MAFSQLSRVAGFFVASRYNAWLAFNTLAVNSGTGVSFQTNAFQTLEDGSIITPFSTLNPVTIGKGASLETVTPTAVSISGGIATITATLANSHGVGDPIISGSGGVYEAAADANSKGGGIVAIDGTFKGSATNISGAAVAYPGVPIADQRTGGNGSGIGSVKVVLSTAQLLALQTTAVALLPAPGAGLMLVPLSQTMQYKFNTTAYTLGNADNKLTTEYTGKTTALIAIAAAGLIDQTASQTISNAPAVAKAAITQANSANLGLEVKATGTTPAFTLGDGSVTVTTQYATVVLS